MSTPKEHWQRDGAGKYACGTMVCLEAGEYSDHRVVAWLVALKDVDMNVLATEFRAAFVPRRSNEAVRHDGFPGWLVAQGHFAPVDYVTQHIGSYGAFQLDCEERKP